VRYHFTAILAAFSACAILSAQDRVTIAPRARPEHALPTRSTLRMDVRMVQIPVTVTDLRGSPVLGLTKKDFRVFEDDVELPVSALSVSDAPVSAGIVFDTSRSMRTRIDDSRVAVEQFLDSSGPSDEFFLTRFSDKVEMLTPFTSKPADILKPLASLEAKGWTALVDAICLATHHVRKGKRERKMLLVLTDGNDNNSRYSESELLRILREADVRVYSISLLERSRFLEKISDETGGRNMLVRRMSDLPAASEELNRQIRSEYLVSYKPTGLRNDGKYHKVRVEVRPPEGMAKVYPAWRRGYMAPDE
jgi:VWFA-related protein